MISSYFLELWNVKWADRWPMTVNRVKIWLISCLKTEQVVAKYLLTLLNDPQGKRCSVEEGDACIDEFQRLREGKDKE